MQFFFLEDDNCTIRVNLITLTNSSWNRCAKVLNLCNDFWIANVYVICNLFETMKYWLSKIVEKKKKKEKRFEKFFDVKFIRNNIYFFPMVNTRNQILNMEISTNTWIPSMYIEFKYILSSTFNNYRFMEYK